MDNERRSPIDRLLFATFLKGRTSSRDLWDEKGEMSPEDNQKIVNETNEIINDDSTYPFISYLTDLLAKSKPSDAAVKKLHDLIDQIAAATGHDSTDIFRVLLAKLIEKPEEQQTIVLCGDQGSVRRKPSDQGEDGFGCAGRKAEGAESRPPEPEVPFGG